MSMRYRWFLFIIVYASAALATFSMYKAAPLYPLLVKELGFTPSNIGLTTSVDAVMGLLLALPAGVIVNKCGYKRTLIGTLILVCLGALLGAHATEPTFLLITRAIEGIGLGMIAVIGPAAISLIMPPNKQGFTQGLYMTWFPLGAVMGMNVSPWLEKLTGSWTGAWWFGAGLSLLLLLCVIFFFQIPETESSEKRLTSLINPRIHHEKPRKPYVQWRSVIFAALSLFFWNSAFCGALLSFYPTFLQQVHGFSQQAAGSTSSLSLMLVVLLGSIVGMISDRHNLQKELMVFASVIALPLYAISYTQHISLVWLYLFLIPIAAASIRTGLYALIPKVAKDPESVAISMGIIAICMNGGIMVGAALFGPMHVTFGWHTAALLFLMPAGVLGLICALAIKKPTSHPEASR